MSENLENKKAIVEEIKGHIQNAKGIFLMNYKGITVSADTALRKGFRDANVDYKVYKNRLMKKACEELGIKFDDSVFEGSTAVAFANDDCLAPARVVAGKADLLKDFAPKAAYVENKYYDADGVKMLSNIPAREVLLAQLVGMLQMPIKKLACTVDAIAKKD